MLFAGEIVVACGCCGEEGAAGTDNEGARGRSHSCQRVQNKQNIKGTS